MTASKHFLVGVLGVPEPERQVLERIFSLSTTRANAYRMRVEPDNAPVDIILVDRLVDGAANTAKAFADIGTPVVSIIGDKPAEDSYTIRRPFTATRTLGVLDGVVENALKPQGTAGTAAPAAAADARPATPGGTQPARPATPPAATPPSPQRVAKRPAQRQGNPADSGAFQKSFLDSGYRALVVADSLRARKQVSMALERSGLSADSADRGETALSLVTENDYDIIFLDVMIPGVDGYELCKTIKRNKLKKNVPIVMLAGASSPFDEAKGKLSGCDTYLIKPVGIREFNRTLIKCLTEPMAFDSIAELT